MKNIVVLGGTNTERLYLKRDTFIYDNQIIEVYPTNLLTVDMNNLIARHKARYYLVGAFLRPNMLWLDIPCGSGYASELLKEQYEFYMGCDIDKLAVEYARRNYLIDEIKTWFIPASLTDEKELESLGEFDIISCIEGIEHLNKENQTLAINSLYSALGKNGILIISTPQAKETNNNPYHLHELSDIEFRNLLGFKFKDVQILKQKDVNHLGEEITYLYGICRKDKK